MERLVTAAELAERLNISKRKAYAMKEEIGFIKLGGNIRFEESAIEAYLEKCRHAPVQPEARYTSSGPLSPPRPDRKVTAATICQLLNEKKTAKAELSQTKRRE